MFGVPQINMSDLKKKYWRSLGERNKSPEYRKQLLKEHRTEHSHDPNKFSRRSFLTIMGASMAMAGLAGCRRPVEKIVPFVKQSEEVIPGVPLYFASTMPFGTSSFGIIVESHEGRPTKIEGNPKHPTSLGASNLFMQASILNLYDPDRSESAINNGTRKKTDDFTTYWSELYEQAKSDDGKKMAVLSESFASPTLFRLKNEFEKTFPNALWATYEPIANENRKKAILNLTGKELNPIFDYIKAEIIVSFDDDFLQSGENSLSEARSFGQRRQIDSPESKLNRLYVLESGYSITGASADHRLRIRSGDIDQFILALAKELKQRGLNLGVLGDRSTVQFDKNWISAIADDLMNNIGKSIITAGLHQSQEVHEAVLAINNALGNIGETITFVEPRDTAYSSLDSLKNLTDQISLGQIDTLIIIGGNPIYNAPADFGFVALLKKVKNSIHFSEYFDETSDKCHWHIPRSHFLESWGDARSNDGTLSVIQPLIAPLFDSLSDVEFYSLMSSGRLVIGYDIVRNTWSKIIIQNFEKGWTRVLHDGLYKDSDMTKYIPKININRLNLPAISTATKVMSRSEDVV